MYEKHRRSAMFLAVGAIVVIIYGLYRFVLVLGWLNQHISEAVQARVAYDATKDQVVVRPSLPEGILAILLLGLVFVVWCFIVIYREHARALEAESLKGRVQELRGQVERLEKEKLEVVAGRLREAETIRKTFNRMMDTTYKITQQTATEFPKKQIIEVEYSYLIHSNYDGEVYKKYRIRAVQVMHFWEIRAGVESDATPQEFLDEIDFKVRDGDGENMYYLPIEDKPHLKTVAVFFLPPLEPGAEKTVVIRYRWPGMFNKIKKAGSERGEWNLANASTTNIETLSFSVYPDPALGRRLLCEIDGCAAGQQEITATTHPQKAWPGKTYSVKNGPPALYALRVELR